MWGDPNKDHSDSKVVDVFSFGMILWELETEEVPFEGLSVDEIRKKIVREKLRPFIGEKTNKELAILIRQCWQDGAQFRPSFQKIISRLARVTFSSK